MGVRCIAFGWTLFVVGLCAGPAVAETPAASDHWAYRAPTRPPVPTVGDPAWVRNPIDHFILARLDAENLSPSPEADRATLIRRMSLDLIGLPPEPEDVAAFVADTRPDAYERLVERLLASPHYGERWGRHWLDAARYADTNGYEKDRPRSIWPYRDWVIRALNEDMPFDRFTIEQIAGDMLPNATLDQRIATGFHRNTMINEEGGIDVEEFRYTAMVDRVSTTSTVWMGASLGCAQCHDHKYDPFSQQEYYRLFALLNNADEPEMDVPTPALVARRESIEAEIAKRQTALADHFPPADAAAPGELLESRRRRNIDVKLNDWARGIQRTSSHWTVLEPRDMVSENHATMTRLDDASVLVSGDFPNRDTYTIELDADQDRITALRLEVLPHPSLPDGGPGRAVMFSRGDFLLTELTVTAAPRDGSAPAAPVTLQNGTHDFAAENRSAALAIDGIGDTGWSIGGGQGKPHAAVFEFAQDVAFAGGARLSITLAQHYIHQQTIGRFRISVTGDARPVHAAGVPAEIEAIVMTPADARTEDERAELERYYLSVAPELAEHHKEIDALRDSMPRYPTTMVLAERSDPRLTRLHHRGEFLSPREPVTPGVPAIFHPLPADAPPDRLALARWLVDPGNPLVGRVTVNRIWQAYFGRGIVATTEDFGTQGDRPTHPKLLDWLATEFFRQGTSFKALHRLIVTSATYRQSSTVTPELLTRDPENLLLARAPRVRADAETVRDIALVAGGLLCRKIGGPSVFPPQPPEVSQISYGAMAWQTAENEDRFRRGLYTFWKRTSPYAAFMAFDSPTADTTCVRRIRSNTPLQALTLLNDAVFVEAAQALARRVLDQAPRERVQFAMRVCLSRDPDAVETDQLLTFLGAQIERFASDPEAAATVAGVEADAANITKLAAWTTVARALLNLDEMITKG